MKVKEFGRVGHLPTLFSSFLYFDISFMIWVMLGALGPFIVEDLQLTPGEKAMMVAIPILGGAILRIPLGLLGDRLGGKRTAQLGMIVTTLPLFLGWLWADSLTELFAVGLLLGIGGASFSVALPLASRWYPKEYQGLAMGIAGAGNSGTIFATLFGPRLATAYSWEAVFAIALIPLVITFIVFSILAKDSPSSLNKPTGKEYLGVLKKRESWLFCYFYSLSFGGFVGLTSFLSIYFVDQFKVDKVTVGDFVTLCVIAGSFARPIGGYIADKVTGFRLLTILFTVGCLSLSLAGFAPTFPLAVTGFVATLLCLGAANGAIFQIIPVYYPKEVALITGIVGAFGGIGGFLLPNLLGQFKQFTGLYSLGFLSFAGLFFVAIFLVLYTKARLQKHAATQSQFEIPQSKAK